MTDKLKPTAEQIQRACDLANASGAVWRIGNYGDPRHSAFTALADTLARAEKAEADLRRIDEIVMNYPADFTKLTIASITAPYRVETDPLVEAFKAAFPGATLPEEDCQALRAELAKRGVTVGEQTDAK